MQEASSGSYYVCPKNKVLHYMKSLAHFLGRDDLIIVGPSWFENSYNMRGLIHDVILDHGLDVKRNRNIRESYTVYVMLMRTKYLRSDGLDGMRRLFKMIKIHHDEAMMDMATYGTGTVFISETGGVKHIPIGELNDEKDTE